MTVPRSIAAAAAFSVVVTAAGWKPAVGTPAASSAAECRVVCCSDECCVACCPDECCVVRCVVRCENEASHRTSSVSRVASPVEVRLASATTPPRVGVTPAEQAAQAVTEFTRTSGDEAVRRFIERCISPTCRALTSEPDLFDALTQLRRHLAGARLHHVKGISPRCAEVVLGSQSTGVSVIMTIEVEPAAPHRITALTGTLSPGPPV